MVPDHSDDIVVSIVVMCCSLNLNSVTGIQTITQIQVTSLKVESDIVASNG